MRLNPALLLAIVAAGERAPPPPHQPRDPDEETRLIAPLNLGKDIVGAACDFGVPWWRVLIAVAWERR